MSASDDQAAEDDEDPLQARYQLFRVRNWRDAVCQFLARLSESWPQAILRLNGVDHERGSGSWRDLSVRLPDVGRLLLASCRETLATVLPNRRIGARASSDVIVLDFRAEGKHVASLVLCTPQWSEKDDFSARAVRFLSEAMSQEASPDYGTMVPGGFDYIVSGVKDPTGAVTFFLNRIVERWPLAVVKKDEPPRAMSQPVNVGDWPSSFPESVIFTIARDAAMQAHWEQTGGAPMPDGDGPLSLYVIKAPDGSWELTLVTPAPANDDEFSAWAVQVLSQACRKPVLAAFDVGPQT